ncbi:Hypothetical protein I595_112 [Croceitalea dokdonensis DOKDO 023]|uniref:Uncharacterized protein n=1 Tax=Croceitalea dokdonensis DOKDO 023 TaxID=1300341 RepID=A0A0P7B1W3_9FLAO|nr:hypothetical protein [Croceitalea dokdonensis]KPM33209.1 Hypothetical protein I595_112 [Croceitalea dokdonensis DOKDO 023]
MFRANYITAFLVVCFLFNEGQTQELAIFKVSDFDLKGPVKMCTVVQSYGREIFEFSPSGLLIKSTTKYNESDSDITLYKYSGGYLMEKRLESYKDGVLDPSSSMVNLFEIDSSKGKVIKEKIISLDKEFFEEQRYYLNEDGDVERVVTSHQNAVDETKIEYTQLKGESTKSTFENGILIQTVRKSTKINKNKEKITITLVKEFLDGKPSTAVETEHDEKGKILSKQLFLFDTGSKQFAPSERLEFQYNAAGVLSKNIVHKGKAKSVKEYVFQFDDSPYKNWVKKIVAPENTYVSRIITYFQEDPATEEN